jgi:quercetin dioxygenase-like cupin family protein
VRHAPGVRAEDDGSLGGFPGRRGIFTTASHDNHPARRRGRDDEQHDPDDNERRGSMNEAAAVAPIALGAGEGEALWFLGMLATIKASSESTAGGVAVIEHLAPSGTGSPLHVHHREDEWFYVTGGELTLWVGGQVINAPAGSFVYGPRDIPHTFTVSSQQARFLLVTEPAGLENFMRGFAEPAQQLTIPPPATEPPDIARMTAIAADYGIEILGPPGIPA